MDIPSIIEKFPNQKVCIEYLEKLRWNNQPICVYYKSERTFPMPKELRHHCKKCNKSFSVTVGTIFHHTRVELPKWFLIMNLMLNAKKGISACQMARDINLCRPTTWKIMTKIRKAMQEDKELLVGILEMDETYVGGKPRKSNDINVSVNNPRGRGTKKECVVGIVERNGNAKATHVTNKMVKAINLEDIVRKQVNTTNSILITDQYQGYSGMQNILPHFKINHKESFAKGRIHTNTIESFWAIVKRGIIGQFHKVSIKYLQHYLNEFCFKYNHRKELMKNVFKSLIKKCLFSK